MKKHILTLTGLILTALFVFTVHSGTYAQTKKTDVKMMFQRQANGKVMQLTVSEQKEFTFYVEGLTTKADVNSFTSNFSGKPNVVSVNIGEIAADGQRQGSIILDQKAKVPYFRELLKNAGINTISIDGELKSVDEIGSDKGGSKVK